MAFRFAVGIDHSELTLSSWVYICLCYGVQWGIRGGGADKSYHVGSGARAPLNFTLTVYLYVFSCFRCLLSRPRWTQYLALE